MNTGSEGPPPVGSHTEWDPLEEVIVGDVAGGHYGPSIVADRIHSAALDRYLDAERGHWRAYPPEMIEAAQRRVAAFIEVLEGEGVRVRRPAPVDHGAAYASPTWRSESGFCAANPRDVILPIGRTFIECPMAERDRYFEAFPYRPLLKEFMARGARWISAPRPELSEALYDPDYAYPEGAPSGPDDDWSTVDPDRVRFVTTEFEPIFDAADFVRCGRDIFGQRSHTTNLMGVRWLESVLGPEYRVHLLPVRDVSAYHVDTTFLPLAPGRALVNPLFLDLSRMPAALSRWTLIEAPVPTPPSRHLAAGMSDWIGMNVLSLDEKRIIVEARQTALIGVLKRAGFAPIPLPFEEHYPFMGGFHCATLDVYRRGGLMSYCD